jgi:hypothetical protein
VVAPGTGRETVSQTGEIVPRREVAVSFRPSGRMTERHADGGDRVVIAGVSKLRPGPKVMPADEAMV